MQVEAGKTTDLGAIKANKGVLLQARVVGADTKTVLPEARFRVGYNALANVVGDDGILRSRVAVSEARGGFDRPKIESAGYVDYELPLATFKTEGEVADLGTIEMKRGNAIVGTIRLEGVPPGTTAPSISFSRENKYDFVNPKEDGNFFLENARSRFVFGQHERRRQQLADRLAAHGFAARRGRNI